MATNNTIEQVKAWMTPALLTIIGGVMMDMKNDVKILLDRTARLEVQVQYEKEYRKQSTAKLVKFKGMELVFDRNKKLHYNHLNKSFFYV
jgi:hypothetical protein